jgi:hypothetical protein
MIIQLHGWALDTAMVAPTLTTERHIRRQIKADHAPALNTVLSDDALNGKRIWSFEIG